MKTLPKGFKDSDIGPIPQDWEVKMLSHVCSMQSGQTITAKKIGFTGNYPCYGGNGFRGYTQTYTHDGVFPIIGRQGALCGNTKLAIGKFYASEHAVVVTCNQKANPIWLYYTLGSMNLNQYAEATAQPGLAVSKIMRQYIPLPLLPEQQAIADALSDIDALIGAQEELLAKKRAIKQGAMQELLTGRRRLPGFPVRPMKQTDIGPIPEDWEVKELNEICSMQSGQAITAKDIDDTGTFPCYGGNGLRGYTKTYTHDGMFPLIGRQGALCGNTKFATGKFYASEHTVVVSCMTNTSPLWLYYMLDRMNLNQYAEASAQPGLAVSKIMRQYIAYPCVSEQAAIAAVLSDMDAEITAVEEELAKHRALKRGMMQELLSGRIRLPYKKSTHKKQNAGE